jgi:hypothetical protein
LLVFDAVSAAARNASSTLETWLDDELMYMVVWQARTGWGRDGPREYGGTPAYLVKAWDVERVEAHPKLEIEEVCLRMSCHVGRVFDDLLFFYC